MARRTRNSLGSAEFPILDPTPTVAPSSSVSQVACGSAGPSNVVLSPEVLAAIQAAASEAARAAVLASTSTAASGVAPNVENAAVSSVPQALQVSASNFASAGGPMLSSMPSLSVTSGTEGRSVVVPSFVNTFAPSVPITSLASSLATSVSASAVPRSAATLLDQPFVVGPGFSSIPHKLVQQITAGKFIDLSDLLAVNLIESENEPQVFLDGRVVFSTTKKRNRRQIEDIVSWVEAFTIYSKVLTSYFPHRWRDLTSYKLLILRTYRQLSGRVWLHYDKAFREHAAATKLTDWSVMNSPLFSLYAAGASARSTPFQDSNWEPTGAKAADQVCRSWNRGKCTAPGLACKYSHKCAKCGGEHRGANCKSSESQSRPRSPVSSSETSKKKKWNH